MAIKQIPHFYHLRADHSPLSSCLLSSEGGILSVTTIVQAFTLRPMERSYGAQPCQAKRPGGPRSSMFQQKLFFLRSNMLKPKAFK